MPRGGGCCLLAGTTTGPTITDPTVTDPTATLHTRAQKLANARVAEGAYHLKLSLEVLAHTAAHARFEGLDGDALPTPHTHMHRAEEARAEDYGHWRRLRGSSTRGGGDGICSIIGSGRNVICPHQPRGRC